MIYVNGTYERISNTLSYWVYAQAVGHKLSLFSGAVKFWTALQRTTYRQPQLHRGHTLHKTPCRDWEYVRCSTENWSNCYIYVFLTYAISKFLWLDFEWYWQNMSIRKFDLCSYLRSSFLLIKAFIYSESFFCINAKRSQALPLPTGVLQEHRNQVTENRKGSRADPVWDRTRALPMAWQ